MPSLLHFLCTFFAGVLVTATITACQFPLGIYGNIIQGPYGADCSDVCPTTSPLARCYLSHSLDVNHRDSITIYGIINSET
jgi:hypothetical protein